MAKRTSSRSRSLCVLCLALVGCDGLIASGPYRGGDQNAATPDAADGTDSGDAVSQPDATSPDATDGMTSADAGDAGTPPAACRGKRNGMLKVFILAGQSNMVGAGTVTPTESHLAKNGGMGTLKYHVENAATASKFAHLVDSKGDWIKRDDVWIVDLEQSGPLTVGYGMPNGHIGPELEFGHVVGDFYEDQVLLIKTSWGGRSLYADFRPPSSGGVLGPTYTLMVDRVHEVLADLKKAMPGYTGGGYEIAGFGWHQGWNDRVSQPATDEYQVNCVNLINDLRKDFCSDGHCTLGMPFVLATTGMGGWAETHPRALALMKAQLAVPSDPGLLSGRVGAVETRDYWRTVEQSPADQGYHWNRNAETYFLIGEGMGKAIQKLVEASCDRSISD